LGRAPEMSKTSINKNQVFDNIGERVGSVRKPRKP
jgi:hypothetical protein